MESDAFQKKRINLLISLEKRVRATGRFCHSDQPVTGIHHTSPYGNETAVDGAWMPGPGMDFFRTIEEKLGKLNIIAEDLGFLTESVLQMLSDSGFPAPCNEEHSKPLHNTDAGFTEFGW